MSENKKIYFIHKQNNLEIEHKSNCLGRSKHLVEFS